MQTNHLVSMSCFELCNIPFGHRGGLRLWMMVFCGLLASVATGQEPLGRYHLEYYGIEEGLHKKDIGDVFQDRDGFIWASYRDGLARFDGLKFWNVINTSNRLSTDGRYLYGATDVKGLLWLFTGAQGCNRILDPKTEAFLELDKVLGGKAPFSISDISSSGSQVRGEGEIFITLKSGRVFMYDGTLTELHKPDGIGWVVHVMRSEKSQFVFWVTETHYYFADMQGKVLQSGTITDRTRPVWVHDDGTVYLYDDGRSRLGARRKSQLWTLKRGEALKPFVLTEGGKLVSLNVTDGCTFDTTGVATICADNHLYVFNHAGQVLQHVVLPTLPSGKVPTGTSAYRSDDGVLWVSTTEGLYKVTEIRKLFNTYLKGVSIRGVTDFGADRLLINTYSGTYQFDVNKDDIALYKSGVPIGLGFARLPDGTLLSGSHNNSMYVLPQGGGTFEEKKVDVFNLYQPYYDRVTGRTLVATQSGLFEYFPSTAKTEAVSIPPLTSLKIYTFYRNSDGLWVCTSGGLFLLDDHLNITFKLTKSQGLPSDDVTWLYQDKQGIYWIATIEGLVKWTGKKDFRSQAAQQFDIFDQKAGFFNQHIYSILEDRFGFLWMPTDYGLVRFDKVSGKHRTFLVRDGIADNEFNFLAQYQTPDGRIVLGGVNGLTIFNPADFVNFKARQAPLFITRLTIFNGSTETSRDESRTLAAKNQIEIGANDVFFEMDFALLDYTDPKMNRYAYYIEGFENNWNYISGSTVRISGIPSGHYVLHVKGQGSGGQWSEDEIAVPLIVYAPFYKKPIFWGLCLALFLGGVYGYNKARNHRILKEKEHLEREVELRTHIISQQKEELQQLDKAKSAFFTNITHELRTPLTLILTPVESLRHDIDAPKHRNYLDLIRNSALKMLDLVNQLLDIAKLESGNMPTYSSSEDAVAFTHNLLSAFQTIAEQKNIRLNLECPDTVIYLTTDFNLLERALANLLSNAIKYSPAATTVTLALTIDDTNESLIWKVSDTGRGIPESELPQVFRRFYRGKHDVAMETEGTGIGLSLVREVARTLGGTATVHSQLGLGSTFSFSLPYQPATTKAASAPASLDNSKEAKPLVLIVEDNPQIRTLLREILSGNFEVAEAADGSQGLQQAFDLIPDLIVSDIMMPQQDGFSFMRVIKEDSRTSHIPAILLTARTDHEDLMTGIDTGADAYMTKPFNGEELQLRLRKLLENREKLRSKWAGLHAEPNTSTAVATRELLFLDEIKHIILTNIDNPDLNGDLIGKQIGMSRMSLHRKLKAISDTSISDMIKAIRLEKAAEMLSTGEHNISEITYLLGFTSLSYFSRAFRDRYGLPPSEWLRNSQGSKYLD